MALTPRIYNKALIRVLRRSFSVWETMGFHVTPNHFYQPIPDTRRLDDRIWSTPPDMVGIDMKDRQQIELLECLSERYRREYETFPLGRADAPHRFYHGNNSFESCDAEILYCMIRHHRPKRIIEIGSGNSTFLSLQAIRANKKESPEYDCHFTAIEPYPTPDLERGVEGLSRLVKKKVQDVPISEFERLEAGDILFIDSTHIMKIGSDVQYECFEIVPRVKRGVLIHFHDIFLPAEYPKPWIMNKRLFWNEQYLLKAFLMFNASFEVVWGSHYMHLTHPDHLQKAFPAYQNSDSVIGPGSFWIRKVK